VAIHWLSRWRSVDNRVMQIQHLLFSQGFGTRRICAGLVEQGLVEVEGQLVTDPAHTVVAQGLRFRVQGVPWLYQERAYLMLNKPAGYECSHRPGAWPSVYTLLAPPLRQRGEGAVPGVQAVGRLDQDTTGLLLLSDDGRFIHRMTSPRHHVPKVYELELRDPPTPQQVSRLLAGVAIERASEPVRAAACSITGERAMQLTLTEGKYHQVKRMLAAVGNPVERLHRSRIGALELPGDLAPGQWRWLQADDLQALG
jgi:16S rRNA pseudouridine516 synthase